MTAKFKFLAALLVLLASWGCQVQADPAPPTTTKQPPTTTKQPPAPTQPAPKFIQTHDRLAWQRVGAPSTLEG